MPVESRANTPKAYHPGWTIISVSSERWATIDENDAHACGITVAHAAYCWGQGEYGRLGTGDEAFRFVPTPVAGGSAFEGVGAGVRHSCGLAVGGRAYCWGANDQGQLGDGTFTKDVVGAALVPQVVPGTLLFVSLSVGDHHSCGIGTDQRLYCWGGNAGGALGRGTVGDQTPALVPSLVFGQR